LIKFKKNITIYKKEIGKCMNTFKINKFGFFENIVKNVKSIKESLTQTFDKKIFLFLFAFFITPLILANYISLDTISNVTEKTLYGVDSKNVIFSFILNLFYMFLMLCFFVIPFYKEKKISSFLSYLKKKRFYFTLMLSFILFFILTLLTISFFKELAGFIAPELKSKIYALFQYYNGVIEEIPEDKMLTDFDNNVMYGSFIGGFVFLLFLFYIIYSFIIINIQKNTSTIQNIKTIFKNLYKNFFNIVVDIFFIILIIFSLLYVKNYFTVLNEWYFLGIINTFLLIFSSFYIYKITLKYLKKEVNEDFE
tara:strand:+ start:73892 stop:74818 length:927 start_codon:yes stop_codon:yes gene_type:complete